MLYFSGELILLAIGKLLALKWWNSKTCNLKAKKTSEI